MARRPHPEESEQSEQQTEKQTKHAKKESNPALSTAFLQIAILILAVFVIVTAYLVGYQYGKLSDGATQTPITTTAPAQQQAAPEQPAAQPAVPQVTKSDKPKVELFIMSYCPYGLQMQKAYIPVAKLLGTKADMQIKWVPYIMHGEKETQENTRQYCIQKEQSDKYLAYATCFVASTDTAACQKSAGIDAAKLQTCYDAADKEFSITANQNDQASWLSGRFPQYNVDKTIASQYGVQGSPTFVINGKQVSASRSSEAIKQAVCAAFNNPPAECKTALNTNQEAPGAGAIGAGSGNPAAAAAECG